MKPKILVSELRFGVEVKFEAERVEPYKEGFMIHYKDNGKVRCVAVPKGYNMIRTLSEKRDLGIFRKWWLTVGKHFESSAAIPLYGTSVELPAEEYYQLLATHAITEGHKGLKGKASIPAWLVIAAILLIVGVAGYFIYNKMIAEQPTPIEDNQPTIEEQIEAEGGL